MASKRGLKNDINFLTNELIEECFAYLHFHPKVNQEKVNETLWALVHSRNELIVRINRGPADPAETKDFYKTIGEDMLKMVDLMDNLT